MFECGNKEAGKVNVAMIFRREELLYDIRNMAFVEGDLMTDEFNHQRHIVQDVGEAGNVDRVTRILDLTIAECRETLYPFTKHDIREAVRDDRLRESKLYGIVLTVPDTFSETTLSYLEKLVHELLVCKVLAEWLRITKPEKASSWGERADEVLLKLRTSLCRRMDKVRIKPHFF